MVLPTQFFDNELSHYEFRLLSVLLHLMAPNRPFKGSLAELAALTGGVSTPTVKRALKRLTELSLISRQRTKKAGGYYDTCEYSPGVTHDPPKSDIQGQDVQIGQEPGVTHDLWMGSPGVTHDPTTAVYSDSDTLASSQLVVTLLPSQAFLIPTVLVMDSHKANQDFKEVEISLKDRFRDPDDDDSIGGIGLIESENPKAVNKRDPKTRGRRPEYEWTSADVAAEFSFQVGRKFPALPGTLNVRKLTIVLATFRKNYQTTPLFELEVLRMWLADPRNLNINDTGVEAPNLYKKYLAALKTYNDRANNSLGHAHQPGPVSNLTVDVVKLLVATDGRSFENTISGRTLLRKHEARLIERAGHVL